MFGESERILQNFLINFIWILSILTERNITSHKLIKYNTKWPQINRVIVTFTWKNFRSHVIWSTNDCKSFSGSFVIKFLTGSHIDKFQVTILANHDVFRFEISVHNGIGMHSFESMEHDSTVKSWLWRSKETNDSDDIKEFHSVNELSEEVNVLTVFEGTNVLHHKGRLDRLKYFFFILNIKLKNTFKWFSSLHLRVSYLEIHFKA